jgi:hypothetical protein
MPDRSRLRALFRGCYCILRGIVLLSAVPLSHVSVVYACGVLHVAVGCFSPMYATAGVVCLDQCDRCNQSIKITQSRSLLHIFDRADYRLDRYAFGIYRWRCIVVAYILLSPCGACMSQSSGHILVSFQLYSVKRPHTAIHRRIQVDTDDNDTASVYEVRTITTTAMEAN